MRCNPRCRGRQGLRHILHDAKINKAVTDNHSSGRLELTEARQDRQVGGFAVSVELASSLSGDGDDDKQEAFMIINGQGEEV